MFCPVCRDEFRAGFTHCARCDVDLVDSLTEETASKPQSRSEREPRAAIASVPMVSFCGFFTLEEARQARDRLREHDIAADILIREAPDSAPADPIREEFWLRVDAQRPSLAHDILGDPEHDDEAVAGGDKVCDACGSEVPAGESFCARCGHRFGGG